MGAEATVKKPIAALFSTAGADAAHLSAGAENRNSVKCQVEHCLGPVSRWAELSVAHARAAHTIKVWAMAACSPAVAQGDPHYPWQEQHAGTPWPLLSMSVCLRSRPTRQRHLRLRGRESRGPAATPSAETSGKARQPSSFAKRGGAERGGNQPASAAVLAAPGQRRRSRTQFGFGENYNPSQSARQRGS